MPVYKVGLYAPSCACCRRRAVRSIFEHGETDRDSNQASPDCSAQAVFITLRCRQTYVYCTQQKCLFIASKKFRVFIYGLQSL